MRIARAFLASVFALACIAGVASPASATGGKPHETLLHIWHAPLTPSAVIGSGLGTLRTYFVPTAVEGKSNDGQFLSAQMTTVAVDVPGNQELRESSLIFTDKGEADQILVRGVASYPAQGGVLQPGQKTVRAIIGGTGKYAGARGYVVSVNNGPDGWLHTFHLMQ